MSAPYRNRYLMDGKWEDGGFVMPDKRAARRIGNRMMLFEGATAFEIWKGEKFIERFPEENSVFDQHSPTVK